jgi:aspartate/glutamate racemase
LVNERPIIFDFREKKKVTMIIYKDIFTNDEMISDAYPLEVIDDVMLRVKAKMVVKGNEEVSIYGKKKN